LCELLLLKIIFKLILSFCIKINIYIYMVLNLIMVYALLPLVYVVVKTNIIVTLFIILIYINNGKT